MRKLVILAVSLGVALVVGMPRQASAGCTCVKFGAKPVCAATISECNQKIAGLCVAPCTPAQTKPVKKVSKKPKAAAAKKKM